MKKPRIIHRHHSVYPSPEHPDQEWVNCVYAGEHEILGKMNLYSRKTVSKGFLKNLLFFVLRNEDRAIDLEDIIKERNAQSIHKSNNKMLRANKRLRGFFEKIKEET